MQIEEYFNDSDDFNDYIAEQQKKVNKVNLKADVEMDFEKISEKDEENEES